MGIRGDRYKAMVPQVVAPLRLKGRMHATEARLLRAHTAKKIKFTLPGPMTIVDTVADSHYGDRVAMAMAFADLLNQEASALQADGIDIVQFDEPAFNVFLDETAEEVADTIGRALRYVPRERLIACTNCGLAPMSREVAEAKLRALAAGAALARQRQG